VTNELVKTKRQVVIIESNREALDRWLEHHPQTPYLHDDATSDEALRAAGLMTAAGVLPSHPMTATT
jgi:Trk K+ transport system NAD-binding subunit